MWLTRGRQECLVLHPSEEQEKQISRDYLVPKPSLGSISMFLYDDDAHAFLHQSATGDHLVKLLDGGPGFLNQVKTSRERVDAIAKDAYSPTEGKIRSWVEHRVMPISLAVRKDGLVAMRPADRQIIRDMKSYDRTISSMIFVGAQYQDRESEELLDSIIRESRHPLPFASDDDQVKDMILSGNPMVLAYSADMYVRNLNEYHSWRKETEKEWMLQRTISKGDVTRQEKILVDLYLATPYVNKTQIRVLVTQSRDEVWYRWTYCLESFEPVEITIKNSWEIERLMNALGDKVKERFESSRRLTDYEMDRDFFERLLEFHLDSFAPI